jgi:hypothetical protein
MGRWVLRTDIRGYGDSNGGTNVIRASNTGLG